MHFVRFAAALAALFITVASVHAQGIAFDRQITTATGVRVRLEPSTSSLEVGKLKLGTVVTVVERSPSRETINGVAGSWVRIAPVEGVEGWIFGGFAMPYDEARLDAIARKIAADRLALAEPTFNDLTDLQALIDRVLSKLSRAGRAELELALLNATARAALAVSLDKQHEQPYAGWIAAQGSAVFPNEIGGTYLLDADLYWEGARRHAALPIGEAFAWAGVEAYLGGECEGYLPCYLESTKIREARYLSLYPSGRHAGEALERIKLLLEDALAPESPFTIDPADHEEIGRLAKELGATVAKTKGPNTKAVLDLLAALAKKYR